MTDTIPDQIAIGAEIEITFATAVSVSEGGISGRKALRDQPLRNFHFTVGPDDAQEMIAIYRAARGPALPVYIYDYAADETVTACFAEDTLNIKVHSPGVITIEDVRLREIFADEFAALT